MSFFPCIILYPASWACFSFWDDGGGLYVGGIYTRLSVSSTPQCSPATGKRDRCAGPPSSPGCFQGGREERGCAGRPLLPSLPPQVETLETCRPRPAIGGCAVNLEQKKPGPTPIPDINNKSHEAEDRKPEEGGAGGEVGRQRLCANRLICFGNEETKSNQIKSNGSNALADWPTDRCVVRLQRSLCRSRLYIYPPFPSSPLSSRLSSINASVEADGTEKKKERRNEEKATYTRLFAHTRHSSFASAPASVPVPAPGPHQSTHVITELFPPFGSEAS